MIYVFDRITAIVAKSATTGRFPQMVFQASNSLILSLKCCGVQTRYLSGAVRQVHLLNLFRQAARVLLLYFFHNGSNVTHILSGDV